MGRGHLKSYPPDVDLRAIGERGILTVLKKALSRVESPGLVRGIGEDCAVIPMARDRYLLVTTDTLVEGTHFRLDYTSPYLLGKKTLAVNLSDLAAMGGVPTHAFFNLAAPEETPVSFVRQMVRGITFWCRRYGVPVVGGDTVSCPGGVVLTVTLLGKGQRGKIVFRSGARAGDLVFVSGCLGDAAAGLELLEKKPELGASYRQLLRSQLDPMPQLELGRHLAEHKLASAMIDLSDGLGTDLAHIAEESGVGAEVDADKLPISKACRRLAKEFGTSPLAWAVAGGEDYGLLFTVPAVKARKLIQNVQTKAGLFCIGRIVKGRGVFLREKGHKRDIAYKGYDHFTKR